jgi:hypothetical protein
VQRQDAGQDELPFHHRVRRNGRRGRGRRVGVKSGRVAVSG